MLTTWGTVVWRVDAKGIVYLSRWDLWSHKEIIWNWTRQVAESAYRKKTGKTVGKELESGGCAFIRPRVSVLSTATD